MMRDVFVTLMYVSPALAKHQTRLQLQPAAHALLSACQLPLVCAPLHVSSSVLKLTEWTL